MSVEWLVYKGKRIVRLDYGGLDEPAMIRELEKAFDLIASEPEVLLLSLFSEQRLGRDYMSRAKEFGREVTKSKKLKNAIVGFNRMQRAYVNTYSFFTKASNEAFETEDEAKKWLIDVRS